MRRWRGIVLGLGAVFLSAQPISIALDKPVMSLNPLLLAREVESQVADLVFDRLVTLDEKGAFVPQLLESWVISKDGRDIHLRLRPGLTWQDGSPIEAEDVAATWRMLSLPQVRRVYDLIGVRTFDQVRAEGPLKVHIHLKRARASLLADLYNFQPVPRNLMALGKAPLQHPLNYAPVGSGPYRVEPGANAHDVRLKKWDGYKGPHPGRWEGFHFQTQPTGPNAYGVQLLAGAYHFGDLDWFHHYLLRKGKFGADHLSALFTPVASFSAFWFNCNPARSLLGDVRVRKALAEALPWEFLKAQHSLKSERLASSLWPPQSWAFDQTVEPIPRLERAAALLDEAGWRRGTDGVRRNPSGRELRLVMFSAWSYAGRDAADSFREGLRRIGVEIDLRRTPAGETYDFAARGQGDIWDFAWNTSLDPDNESPLFTTEGIRGGTNPTGYHDPEVDRWFEEGRHETDPARRRAIYLNINRRIQRDQPLLQLTYGVAYLVVDRRLHGVGFNQMGQTYGYVPGRRGWWLEP